MKLFRSIGLTLIAALCCVFSSLAQVGKNMAEARDGSGIVFRDTMLNIAFDSVSNNMTAITSEYSYRFVKNFKYLGAKPLIIVRAWTPDPHFICEYPREPLFPGGVYAFTVCFANLRYPQMNTEMGFDFSDGTKAALRFFKKDTAPNTRRVSGTVFYTAGETIPGVYIFVKSDRNRQTRTDIDGRYAIAVKPDEFLEFEFMGMDTGNGRNSRQIGC